MTFDNAKQKVCHKCTWPYLKIFAIFIQRDKVLSCLSAWNFVLLAKNYCFGSHLSSGFYEVADRLPSVKVLLPLAVDLKQQVEI